MPSIGNNRRAQIQGNIRKGKGPGEKLDPGYAPKAPRLKGGKGLGSPGAAAAALGGLGIHKGTKGKSFGQGMAVGPSPDRSPLKGLGSRQAAAPGVSGKAQAGLGAQLSHKVSSGALTQQQAQKVAAQRAVLEKVYGPDWRTKVFGKGGAKAQSGPFARAQNNAARNKALEAVKNKAIGKKFGALGGKY